MTRDIHLLIYPQHRNPCHWAFFIPEKGSSTKGKVIHVTGSRFTGFRLEFKRNYDLTKTRRWYEMITLAQVQDEVVVDVPGDGTRSLDTDPHDQFEVEACKIDAPGPSKTPLDPSAENCQSWMWKYINWLVEKELIAPTALDILKDARTH